MALSVTHPAWGWVPPADFLLGQIYKRRKNLRGLRIKGQLFIYDASLPGGRRQVEQVLYFKPPASIRIEVKGLTGDYLEIADGKRKVSVRDGKVTPQADGVGIWRALMIGDPFLLKANAKAHGVDFTKVSLGRLVGADGEPRRGDICFVVGALAGEDEPAQIWIDKVTHQPRLLKDAGPSRSARVLTFDDWQEQAVRGWYPGMTRRKRGERIIDEFRVEELKTDAKLPARLFDVKSVAAQKKP